MARRNGSAWKDTGNFLLGFLSGLLVGSAVGVLFAPHRGQITRRKIRRKVEDVRNQVDETVEDLKS